MKEHQNPRRIAAGRERPFGRYSPCVDRRKGYILRDRPDRADLIEAQASFHPPDRARLGTQQRADGVDFTLNHARSVTDQPDAGDL
jgi:hypothetical protein